MRAATVLFVAFMSACAVGLKAQALETNGEALDAASKVIDDVTNARYTAAAEKMTGIGMFIRQHTKRAFPDIAMVKSYQELTPILQGLSEMRDALTRRDYTRAFTLNFALGMGIVSLDQKRPAVERFQSMQARQGAAADAKNPFAIQALAVGAWQTGERREAERRARQLLDLLPELPPIIPRPGLAHTAHTVLGLAAAERGDLDGAAVHLRDSLGAATDVSLTTRLPNLMLAEALLAAGRTAPVAAYLEAASKIPWYGPELGRVVAEFQSQYQAGNLRTFGAAATTLH